jgi:uncharacterized protein (DUF697 family)
MIAGLGGSLRMPDETVRSEAIIKKYAYLSMGAGLIPIPVLDMAAVLGLQLRMVAVLAKEYKEDYFSHDKGKAFIASLVGSSVPATGGPAIASLLKRVPVIGQTVGVLAMPALAGASTYAVGKVFAQHFASGGTFLTFNPDKVLKHYEQHLSNAKTALAKA